MDEQAQHANTAKCHRFAYFVFCFVVFLGSISLAFGVAGIVIDDKVRVHEFIIAGVFMGVGFIGIYLVFVKELFTGFHYKNARFTASANTKARAKDALRNSIPLWRDAASLTANSKIVRRIEVLTLAEIKEVYPHATQTRQYDVEFDFASKFTV